LNKNCPVLALLMMLLVFSAMNTIIPVVTANSTEAKIRGLVTNQGILIGSHWWDVQILEIISDSSGSLTIGSTVQVGFVVSPPFPQQGYTDVQVGDRVEVYGQVGPPGTFDINLNGENYYIILHAATGPVGGVTLPTNKLEILTAYLTLAGLAAAVSAVVVVKRRRD
jgi:hypothetical protein